MVGRSRARLDVRTAAYGGGDGVARQGDIAARVHVPARHVSVQPCLTKFYSNFCY
jgi:hypothetical protein